MIEKKEVLKKEAKKINFSALPVSYDLGKNDLKNKNYIPLDFRKELGNLMYSGCVDLGTLNLAQKIYNSAGEIELDDVEMNLLKNSIKKMGLFMPIKIVIYEKLGIPLD